jgi:hypothetical protein
MNKPRTIGHALGLWLRNLILDALVLGALWGIVLVVMS